MRWVRLVLRYLASLGDELVRWFAGALALLLVTLIAARLLAPDQVNAFLDRLAAP